MIAIVINVLLVFLPLVALISQLFNRSVPSERHHRHHDTYTASSRFLRMLVIVMCFMGVLGLTITWLCNIGIFKEDTIVVQGFFVSFMVVAFVIWLCLKRYSVIAYKTYLVYTPPLGRRALINYIDITSMQWTHTRTMEGIENLRIFVVNRARPYTLTSALDLEQILLHINRNDVLEDFSR